MNFQDRFKGRTSQIGKDGVLGLLSQTGTSNKVNLEGVKESNEYTINNSEDYLRKKNGLKKAYSSIGSYQSESIENGSSISSTKSKLQYNAHQDTHNDNMFYSHLLPGQGTKDSSGSRDLLSQHSKTKNGIQKNQLYSQSGDAQSSNASSLLPQLKPTNQSLQNYELLPLSKQELMKSAIQKPPKKIFSDYGYQLNRCQSEDIFNGSPKKVRYSFMKQQQIQQPSPFQQQQPQRYSQQYQQPPNNFSFLPQYANNELQSHYQIEPKEPMPLSHNIYYNQFNDYTPQLKSNSSSESQNFSSYVKSLNKASHYQPEGQALNNRFSLQFQPTTLPGIDVNQQEDSPSPQFMNDDRKFSLNMADFQLTRFTNKLIEEINEIDKKIGYYNGNRKYKASNQEPPQNSLQSQSQLISQPAQSQSRKSYLKYQNPLPNLSQIKGSHLAKLGQGYQHSQLSQNAKLVLGQSNTLDQPESIRYP